MAETLYSQLSKRLGQLEHRKMMIPRYIENNKAFLGKNPYTLEMVADIEKQIAETEAALTGIEVWREKNKQIKKILK